MKCYMRATGPGGKPKLQEVMPQPGLREVIVFPGIDGMRKLRGEQALSGLLKLIPLANPELAEQKVQISGVMYEFTDPGDLRDSQQFIEQQLLPRLGLVEKDKKPSVREVIKAISHLTFVTHSYGGKFAQDVADALTDVLRARGYSRAEIKNIRAAGLVIATAGHTSVYRENQFTTLYFRGVNDPVPPSGPSWHDQPEESIIQQMGYKDTEALRVRPLKHGALICAPLNSPVRAVNPESGQVETWSTQAFSVLPPRPENDPKAQADWDKQALMRRIFDIRHSPRANWLPQKGEGYDTGPYVMLKKQALMNAIARPPKCPHPDRLLTSGEILPNTMKLHVMRGMLDGMDRQIP